MIAHLYLGSGEGGTSNLSSSDSTFVFGVRGGGVLLI